MAGRIPFPHSGATLMDALQLLTWSLILICLPVWLRCFYSVWTDWLLSFRHHIAGGRRDWHHQRNYAIHAGVTLVAHFATPFDFADLPCEWIASRHLWCWLSPCWWCLFALFIDLYARIRGQRRGGVGFFMNLFIASMVALLVMDNLFGSSCCLK